MQKYCVCLFGLAIKCPAKEQEIDCLLNDLREKPLEEIFEHIESLEIEEQQSLWNYHKECFQKKINDEFE